MQRQLTPTAVTYQRTVPSVPGRSALQPLPRYGALEPLHQPWVGRASSAVLGAILLLARVCGTLLRYWRQTSEARRARQHLLELDDRLLKDIGVTRADVRFGNNTSKGVLR